MKQLKRELDELDQESVKEYLARGGKITVCEAGARTENIQVGQWTRNRRRSPSKSPPAAKEQLKDYSISHLGDQCSTLGCYSVETVTFPCVQGSAP